jgi:hypothetical protein
MVLWLAVACTGGGARLADGGGSEADAAGGDAQAAPDGAVICPASQVAMIAASDREVQDRFGDTVAIDGDTVIVGAPREASGGMPDYFAGAVYMFERSGGAWTEVAAVRPADRSQDALFGKSVDVSGDHAIVGGPGQLDPAGLQVGAAYILGRGDGWAPTLLRPSDAQVGDAFGFSVTIEGSIAAVSSVFEAGGPGDPVTAAGAVYVFERDAAGVWNETAIVRASDPVPGHLFGYALALSGGTLAVTADVVDPVVPGEVYLFERAGDGSWTEVAQLTPSDGVAGDEFGFDVAIDGPRMIVSAYSKGAEPLVFAGAAYVFERDAGGTWSEAAKLVDPDAGSYDQFGYDVAIQGDRAIVTNPGEDGPEDPFNNINIGYAYLYERSPSGSWDAIGAVTAPVREQDTFYGHAVDLSGGTFIVGNSGYASAGPPLDSAGAAFLYDCP